MIFHVNRITCNLIAPFCYLLFSVDAHFGTATSGDAEIPICEDISDEEKEKRLGDEDEEVTSTQTRSKVPWM